MAAAVDYGAPSLVPETGPGAWLSTADHKKVGRLYIALSLVFSLVAVVATLLFRLERLDAAGKVLLNASEANQIKSLFLDSEVFLLLIPAWLGIGLLVVPLQIGSRTAAFPRAAAASFWLYALSGFMVVGSYAANGGPAGGRAKYIDLYYIGMFGVVLALIIGFVGVVVTALTLRSPGLTIARIPAFAWSSVVLGSMLVLTLPVMLGNIVLAFINHRYNNVLGTHGTSFDWVFRQPQIYVLAIPAVGFAAEVVPVFARARQRMRGAVQFAIAGVGVLGAGAWAQTSLNPSVRTEVVFIAMSVLIGLPVVVSLGAFGDTLKRGGKPVVSAPLIAGLGAMVLLLAAVGAGIATGISKLEVVGTTWELGHYKLVASASATAAIGAVIYWSPKIWGKSFNKGLAFVAVGLGIVGTLLTALPDLINGILDQPMLAIDFSTRDGQQLLNVVSFIGEALASLAGVAFLIGVLKPAAGPDAPADNPWNGHTLEWATTSPPAFDNFGSLPLIASAEPLIDQYEAVARENAISAKGA